MICRSTWVSHKETFTAFTTLTKQIYGDIDLIMTVAQSERARYNSLLWKSTFVAQYCRCNQRFLSFDKFTIESRNASLPLPRLALFIHCSRLLLFSYNYNDYNYNYNDCTWSSLNNFYYY